MNEQDDFEIFMPNPKLSPDKQRYLKTLVEWQGSASPNIRQVCDDAGVSVGSRMQWNSDPYFVEDNRRAMNFLRGKGIGRKPPGAPATKPVRKAEIDTEKPLPVLSGDSGFIRPPAAQTPGTVRSITYERNGGAFAEALRDNGGSFEAARLQTEVSGHILNEWLHNPSIADHLNAIAREAGGQETLKQWQENRNKAQLERLKAGRPGKAQKPASSGDLTGSKSDTGTQTRSIR